MSDETRYGYCQCGCGGKTTIAAKSDRHRGAVKGEPRRFLFNHHASTTNRPRRVLSPSDYTITDRGFVTPCWVWAAKARSGNGYVQVGLGGQKVRAHRAYYEHFVGPIPDGFELDHLCRVRDCVRPDHLEPVTHTENMRRGTNTRIPEEFVRLIREAEGTAVEIGRRFGVSTSHAWDIRAGKARV